MNKAIIALVSFFAWSLLCFWQGYRLSALDWSKREQAQADAHLQAIQDAVESEREAQRKVNDALEKQNRRNQQIAANLVSELDSLRERAERAERMSETARTSCAGADGRELSRQDAEFLARESARADEIRAGLEACYAVLDGMKK